VPTARHDSRRRARRSAPASGPSTRAAEASLSGEHSRVLQLQQHAGNAATSTLLTPAVSPVPGGGDVIQRKTRPNRRNRPKKKGRKATAGRIQPASQPAEQPEPQSWGSWLGGVVSSGMSMFGAGTEASAEGEETLADGSSGSSEETTGDFEDEEEKGIGSLFGPPEISITLHEKEFTDQWDGADVEGKSSLKYLLAESTYEGEASFEIKQGTEVTRTLGKVKMYGGKLTTEVTSEEFLGEKSSGKVKGSLGPGKAMLRGELGTFRGYEQKTSGSLSINLGDKPLVTLTGGVGYTIGRGGKAEGLFNYDHGKITMGSKTSVSLGQGVSWDYKIELDTLAIADGLWAVLASWGSWLSDVSTSLDEALTDEDGEPIRIF
jgi:hypothetical protein